MSLVYKSGDVLNSGEKIVIHGCNCFCAMGAGIAKQVRSECPNTYNADQNTLFGDRNKLGSFTYGIEFVGMIVVNSYTQYKYTRIDVDVDYAALEESIRSIVKYFFRTFAITIFAMPKIGCGMAGGDWGIVSNILEEILVDNPEITFHVYEL